MSDDLVSRLKSCAKDCTMLGDEVDAAFFNEAATALTEARAEIERRDAFIKELSDALRSIRPLGGSELFVKRFGNHYADPVYCKAAIEQDAEHKHNAMKAYVKERRRAEATESELSTLRAELDASNANHRQMAKQMADLGRDLAEAIEILRLVDHVRGTAEDTVKIAKMIQDFVKLHAN